MILPQSTITYTIEDSLKYRLKQRVLVELARIVAWIQPCRRLTCAKLPIWGNEQRQL